MVTELTATNPPVNGRVQKEFLIKFEFLQKNDNKAVPVMLYHRQLMCSILNAYKNQVVLFDKHEQPIDQVRINKIQSNIDHQALFDVHTKDGVTIKHKNGKITKRPPRHTVIMMIKTALSLNDIRNTEVIMHHLRNYNAFLRLHHFDLHTHDITSCGWFRELHPTQMCHTLIRQYIETCIKHACGPETNIPSFNLAFCNPNFEDEEDHPMKTKALEIQCERKLSRTLDRLIKKGFIHNPIYVPWRTRHHEPDRYRSSLRAQFKYLFNTWTLPVSGINRYEMAYLQPDILKTGFITSVQPCRTTDTLGRWNLLINRNDLFAATEAVTTVIANYSSIVPTTPECATWTYPRLVGSSTKSSPTDKSSEGDNSYAAASITSLCSILTAEDQHIPVTTTNASFDLSAMEVTPPTGTYAPPTSYANAVQTTPSGPSASETRLSAQVAQLTAQLTEMSTRMNTLLAQTTAPLLSHLATSETPALTQSTDGTATPSTITTESLYQIQATNQAKTDAMFKLLFAKLNIPDEDLEIADASQSLKMAAASSPSNQSALKRQDSKATPSRPLADAMKNQHP